ncbi:MAG: exodeoxyribonuclease V subunit beta [Zoogloeaceae bacterium]|jgi:exodeoxyribonuclease V beta subunit|nr:exodeoxyribonuclease V subunit beta [Zoogloeaceae bacterium]
MISFEVQTAPLAGVSLVEASAGTGKTWAICALAARLVAERGLDIGQILIVTFTKAATAELRERVRRRLADVHEQLERAPDTEGGDPFTRDLIAALERQGVSREMARLRLRTALSAFDEAAIFTIHGFCQRTLDDNPFAAVQPFARELGDTTALIRQAAVDYWRQFIAHGALSAATAGELARQKLTPDLLEKLLARALQKPLTRPLWPDNLPPFPPDESTETSAGALDAAWQAASETWRAERKHVLQELEEHLPFLHRTVYTPDRVESGAKDWDAFFALDDPRGELPKEAQNFRSTVLENKTRKSPSASPPSHAFFRQAEALCEARETCQQETGRLRLALFRHFLDWGRARVDAEKRRRRLADFDSLLTDLHHALAEPGGDLLAARLRARYPVALIDEFQDTDPVQFGIFSSIYGIRTDGGARDDVTMFWVGDPKQAIYSFRQADLHTYLRAKRLAGRQYALNVNQRSAEGVIAGVNALFGQNARAFMLPGLAFVPARRGQNPLPTLIDDSGVARAACHFLALPEKVENKEARSTLAAQATAAEIARLLDAARRNLVRIGDAPLAPGRIAVLVRTHRQGQRIKEALREVGVQASERAQTSVFASPEAEDLERFLLALSEPARADLMKTALATRLIGLAATRVASLEQDESAFTQWADRFHRWRQCWLARGIATALAEARRELQIPARLLASADGERRLTNFLHLAELLHQMEANEAPQPARLLEAFAHARQSPDGDIETHLLRLESDRDLIHIVTIHQSKGLEYDIVFCPFLWDDGKYRDGELPGIAYHDDGNLVFDFRPEAEARARMSARQEQAEERLRLAYVALTRAVHRCYLVYDPCGSGGLLNWLAAGRDFQPHAWIAAKKEALPDVRQLRADWQHLIAAAQGSAETLSVSIDAPCHRFVPDAPRFRAAIARRVLLPDWRIDSFSGLVAGMRHTDTTEAEASDHDTLPASSATGDAPPDDLPADDILRFPCGPRAGDFLHALLERADFGNPGHPLDDGFPQGSGFPAEGRAIHPRALTNLLRDVLTTPLALPGVETPLYLKTLPPGRRFMELEFHLSVSTLDVPRLTGLLVEHGETLPRLDFSPLRGFLRGFIDMVCVHEDRYYVFDWKSNHLGWTPAAYCQESLARAMLEHGYTLQSRLYLLALHRYLELRLPGYDPERHLGGCCYLFLRGVRPDWRQPDGTQTGVFTLPPKPDLMRAMDALTRGARLAQMDTRARN